jgi:tripartite-type tricarboxylate transporter receptor subunit TctC
MKRLSVIAGLAAVLATPQMSSPAAAADPVADFYKGKQVEFIISGAPGSSVDQWARLYSRHLPRFVPGNPVFIPKNMPGGGHIIATNYFYNQAPRDGTSVAMVSRAMAVQEVLGNPAVKFKMLDFNWLGSPERANRICVSIPSAKVKKAADLFENELIVGGAGTGAPTTTSPVLLNKLLGMKFKTVDGYPSSGDIFLAMERGESEGICQTVSGIESVRPGWISGGKVNVLFNLEKEPIASMKAPSIYSFTKTEEERQIIGFYNSSAELGRPVMTAPGVPPERVAALRKAIADVMKDKQFMEEATKQGLEIAPLTGDQVRVITEGINKTPKALIDKTIDMVGSLSE